MKNKYKNFTKNRQPDFTGADIMDDMRPEKEDITRYSDSELSLRVFNDITLYTIRHEKAFLGMIEDMYQYNQDQLEVLLTDLYNDKQENKLSNN